MRQNQSSSTVQGEFFKSFSKTFFMQFEKYGDLIGCFDDKNFNERQSYGLVVTSLMDIKGVDFVLTEVGMVRNGDVEGKKSSGRVDYLIGFGGWLFLIELKLEFSGLKDIEKVSSNCANAWGDKANGVVSQLKGITTKNNPVLRKIIRNGKYEGFVKFPMLIVMYAPYNKEDISSDEVKEKVKGRHSAIARQLRCTFIDKYCILKTPIPRKHTNRKGGVQLRTTYGVGIMAGSKGLR